VNYEDILFKLYFFVRFAALMMWMRDVIPAQGKRTPILDNGEPYRLTK